MSQNSPNVRIQIRHNSQLVTRLFINRVSLTQRAAKPIVYGAFEQIKEATGTMHLKYFETAMKTSCLLEVCNAVLRI